MSRWNVVDETTKSNTSLCEHGRTYTHVVSLGADCRPSYQLKRYFCSSDAYCFDRWVTPLDSLALYLKTLEANLYDPSDLLPIVHKGSLLGLRNKRYDLRFFHEWPKNPTIQPPDGEIMPGWEAFSDEVTQRTNHLIGKLTALNKASNLILFVRDGDWLSNLPLDSRAMSAEEAFEGVLAALTNRFPLAAFDILCLNFSQRHAARIKGKIFFMDLVDLADDWRGSDDLWSEAFGRLDARMPAKPNENDQ